jgi:hypothetical protein
MLRASNRIGLHVQLQQSLEIARRNPLRPAKCLSMLRTRYSQLHQPRAACAPSYYRCAIMFIAINLDIPFSQTVLLHRQFTETIMGIGIRCVVRVQEKSPGSPSHCDKS